MNYKKFMDKLTEGVDILTRSDYKLDKAGKKSHKEIVFHNGSVDQEKDDKLKREEVELEEKLTPSMGAGAYIKDFQKSDAPQFKGKSKEKKRMMGIAAYMAAKKGMKEETVVEAKDEKEYGYEGDMAMTQLETAIRHATHLKDMMEPDTDLPEWVQSKITLATDYLQTACDYMTSEMNEALKGNQHKIDKNKNGKVDAHDFKLLRKEETLDEALDPSEIAGNPKMYDAATVKKAYYHKSTSASDKESLARHLDRHHGNKEWRNPVKEEAEQIDELSKGTLASYAKKATNSARITQSIGKDFEASANKSRKPGMKDAAQSLADKYKSKSRSREAGVGKAIDRLAKEEFELDEAMINGREYASHGLMHPDHAAHAVHKVTGSTIDFYAHGSGDKVSGKVTKNDGKAVHIKDTSGKTHQFKVQRGLPKQQNEEVELDESVATGNPGRGYHGEHDSDKADSAYSKAHSMVKKVAGESGHMRDVKKPNVMVKHYLDSVHGRHLKGNENAEYIKKDFGKFKKTYKPEMHEGVNFDDQGNLMAEKKSYSQFMEQLLEYESDKEGVYRHTKGSYGKSYDSEDDDKPSKAEPSAVKRGRGRPAGAKSGANQKVSSGKSYGGIATHTLNLPK
jgi:hypothetical protein